MEKGGQALSKKCEVLVSCFEAIRIRSGRRLLLLPLQQHVRMLISQEGWIGRQLKNWEEGKAVF